MQRIPSPLPVSQRRARQRRVARIARGFGFLGRVEYRHVYSSAGGAQYGLATTPEHDVLFVYAEAFERDADPDDYSLEAILAHERGHQLLARHSRLTRIVPTNVSEVSEEVLASLIGSLVVDTVKDQEDLIMKAVAEAIQHGLPNERAIPLLMGLRELLERAL